MTGEKLREEIEKYIGRRLYPDETVHHIDGNPKNNDLSNIYLFKTKGEHGSYHTKVMLWQ